MDKNLKRYYDIKNGIGRPEILNQMYEFARHIMGNDPVKLEVYECANRISRVWKEEKTRDMIFALSLDLMSLQERLERNGLEAHVDLSGCFCKACTKADEETKQRLQEEVKQKSQEAMDKLSELDEELGIQ
jgi:hypothetical protein